MSPTPVLNLDPPAGEERGPPPFMATTERPASSSPCERFDRTTYAGSRPPKRLVLDLPILSPTLQPTDSRSTSPHHVTSADPQSSSPRLPAIAASPNDSSTFLTSLAAQERRVLELREELKKAEVDLSRLKKQWAQHEAGRKRSELRNAEQLQPFSPLRPSMVAGTVEGSVTPASALKTSLENGTTRPVTRRSAQRVFSGSRHTRALSLLSPGAVTNQSARRHSSEEAVSPTVAAIDIHSEQRPHSRSSAISGGEQIIEFGRTYKQLAGRRSMPPRTKDVFMSNGTKVATELREGLWTFLEDIRQATVGEEGINGIQPRTARSERGQRQAPRQVHDGEQARKWVKTTERTTGEKRKEAEVNIACPRADTPSRRVKENSCFGKEYATEASSNKHTNSVAASGLPNPEEDQPLVEVDDYWNSWDLLPAPRKPTLRYDTVEDDKTASVNDGPPSPEPS